MNRKQAGEILRGLGCNLLFSLRGVSFQDLARKNAQVLTIIGWTAAESLGDPQATLADSIRAAFAGSGVVVRFVL